MLHVDAGRGPAGGLCPGTLKVSEPETWARRCFQAGWSGSSAREGLTPSFSSRKSEARALWPHP